MINLKRFHSSLSQIIIIAVLSRKDLTTEKDCHRYIISLEVLMRVFVACVLGKFETRGIGIRKYPKFSDSLKFRWDLNFVHEHSQSFFEPPNSVFGSSPYTICTVLFSDHNMCSIYFFFFCSVFFSQNMSYFLAQMFSVAYVL